MDYGGGEGKAEVPSSSHAPPTTFSDTCPSKPRITKTGSVLRHRTDQSECSKVRASQPKKRLHTLLNYPLTNVCVNTPGEGRFRTQHAVGDELL